MKTKSRKKLFEEYHRRFANGEQYIQLNLANKQIISADNCDYYWQERGVYNHILPIIKSIAKNLPEDELYSEHGLVSLLIPFQRAYNTIKNRELEYINRQTYGVLAVEDGSIDIDALEEDGLNPGQVIVYRQGSVSPRLINTGLDTSPYLKSADNLIAQMRNLAKSYCEGYTQLQECIRMCDKCGKVLKEEDNVYKFTDHDPFSGVEEYTWCEDCYSAFKNYLED